MVKYQNSIYYFSYLFGFILPLSTKFSNISLSLFCITILLTFVWDKRRHAFQNPKILFTSTLLLIIPTIISLFTSEDIAFTINIVGKRVSYLLIPIGFLFIAKDKLPGIKKYAIKGLFYGGLISSSILLLNIFYKYFLTKLIWTIDKDLFDYYHTNRFYTEILDIHPTYYGAYLLLGYCALFTTGYYRSKTLKILAIFIITFSLLFLSSRIVIGLFISINVFFLIQFVYNRTKDKMRSVLIICAALVFSIITFVILFKNTYFYKRLTEESLWELSYEKGSYYNTKGYGDSRLARWEVAISCIEKKPILGYGVGFESEVLTTQYRKEKMSNSEKHEYNAHNQFLGFSLEGGIMGLVFICYFFGSNILLYSRQRDTLSLLFFLCVFSICLFENYLIRNAGIIFVAFYGSLFLFINKNTFKLK